MAKLVACKACDKNIAKGVKKCPDCGKDQRNWFMKHKIMTFLGAIILIIIVSNLGGSDEKEASGSKEDTKAKQTENKETVYKVGDVVDAKKLEVTISNFEEMETIGDPSFLGKEASDGGTLVAIQYTMKNVSDKPVGMFSYPSLKLVDENGTEYSTDVEASSAYAVETKIDNSKILSDLNPDISVTSVDVYEVSKAKFAEGKWYIQIDDSKVEIK